MANEEQSFIAKVQIDLTPIAELKQAFNQLPKDIQVKATLVLDSKGIDAYLKSLEAKKITLPITITTPKDFQKQISNISKTVEPITGKFDFPFETVQKQIDKLAKNLVLKAKLLIDSSQAQKQLDILSKTLVLKPKLLVTPEIGKVPIESTIKGIELSTKTATLGMGQLEKTVSQTTASSLKHLRFYSKDLSKVLSIDQFAGLRESFISTSAQLEALRNQFQFFQQVYTGLTKEFGKAVTPPIPFLTEYSNKIREIINLYSSAIAKSKLLAKAPEVEKIAIAQMMEDEFRRASQIAGRLQSLTTRELRTMKLNATRTLEELAVAQHGFFATETARRMWWLTSWMAAFSIIFGFFYKLKQAFRELEQATKTWGIIEGRMKALGETAKVSMIEIAAVASRFGYDISAGLYSYYQALQVLGKQTDALKAAEIAMKGASVAGLNLWEAERGLYPMLALVGEKGEYASRLMTEFIYIQEKTGAQADILVGDISRVTDAMTEYNVSTEEAIDAVRFLMSTFGTLRRYAGAIPVSEMEAFLRIVRAYQRTPIQVELQLLGVDISSIKNLLQSLAMLDEERRKAALEIMQLGPREAQVIQRISKHIDEITERYRELAGETEEVNRVFAEEVAAHYESLGKSLEILRKEFQLFLLLIVSTFGPGLATIIKPLAAFFISLSSLVSSIQAGIRNLSPQFKAFAETVLKGFSVLIAGTLIIALKNFVMITGNAAKTIGTLSSLWVGIKQSAVDFFNLIGFAMTKQAGAQAQINTLSEAESLIQQQKINQLLTMINLEAQRAGILKQNLVLQQTAAPGIAKGAIIKAQKAGKEMEGLIVTQSRLGDQAAKATQQVKTTSLLISKFGGIALVGFMLLGHLYYKMTVSLSEVKDKGERFRRALTEVSTEDFILLAIFIGQLISILRTIKIPASLLGLPILGRIISFFGGLGIFLKTIGSTIVTSIGMAPYLLVPITSAIASMGWILNNALKIKSETEKIKAIYVPLIGETAAAQVAMLQQANQRIEAILAKMPKIKEMPVAYVGVAAEALKSEEVRAALKERGITVEKAMKMTVEDFQLILDEILSEYPKLEEALSASSSAIEKRLQAAGVNINEVLLKAKTFATMVKATGDFTGTRTVLSELLTARQEILFQLKTAELTEAQKAEMMSKLAEVESQITSTLGAVGDAYQLYNQVLDYNLDLLFQQTGMTEKIENLRNEAYQTKLTELGLLIDQMKTEGISPALIAEFINTQNLLLETEKRNFNNLIEGAQVIDLTNKQAFENHKTAIVHSLINLLRVVATLKESERRKAILDIAKSIVELSKIIGKEAAMRILTEAKIVADTLSTISNNLRASLEVAKRAMDSVRGMIMSTRTAIRLGRKAAAAESMATVDWDQMFKELETGYKKISAARISVPKIGAGRAASRVGKAATKAAKETKDLLDILIQRLQAQLKLEQEYFRAQGKYVPLIAQYNARRKKYLGTYYSLISIATKRYVAARKKGDWETVEKALNALETAREAFIQSRVSAQEYLYIKHTAATPLTGASLIEAYEELKVATVKYQATYKAYGKRAKQTFEALKELNTARAKYYDEIINRAKFDLEFQFEETGGIYISRLRAQFQKYFVAQRELNFVLQYYGASSQKYREALLNFYREEKDYIRTSFEEREDILSSMVDLGMASRQELKKFYEQMITVTAGDLRTQLEYRKKLKDLIDELNSNLEEAIGLPSIKVPSPQELRKALIDKVFQDIVVNIMISKEVDAQSAINKALSQLFGFNLGGTIGF